MSKSFLKVRVKIIAIKLYGYILTGTTMGVAIYPLHHDPLVWEDPEVNFLTMFMYPIIICH